MGWRQVEQERERVAGELGEDSLECKVYALILEHKNLGTGHDVCGVAPLARIAVAVAGKLSFLQSRLSSGDDRARVEELVSAGLQLLAQR